MIFLSSSATTWTLLSWLFTSDGGYDGVYQVKSPTYHMVTPQQPTLDYLRATPTVPTLYTATSHLINNISDENTNTTATKLLWQPMKDNIMLNTTTTCLAAKQRIRLNLLAHQK